MSAANAQNERWGTRKWFATRYVHEGVDSPTAYFSHAVNGYQRFRHRHLGEWLSEALGDETVDTLLDIGCGTGALTAQLARQLSAERAVGVDFIPEAIEQGRIAYPDVEFLTGQLPALDFPHETFDVVIASEVLYYLGLAERLQAIGEIERVLRPRGCLLFTSRLGTRYFSVDSARSLVATRLKIQKCGFLHNEMYHALMKPFRGVRSLEKFARDGQTPGNRHLAATAQAAPALWRNRLSRFCLSQLGRVDRCLLRSANVPAFCHRVSKFLAPRVTRSNVILLGRKERVP